VAVNINARMTILNASYSVFGQLQTRSLASFLR
jgi:hypothetical protein